MSVGLVMAWDQRGGLLAGAGKLKCPKHPDVDCAMH